MPVVNQKLTQFPGFAVQYDPTRKPFFKAMALQDLRKIATKKIGRTLLRGIAAARPRARSTEGSFNDETKAVVFYEGINVVMIGTTMEYIESGFQVAFTGRRRERTLEPSDWQGHNVPGCPYYPAGGSSAEAADAEAAEDGTGSVTVMRFTNAQIVTSRGEATYSFIVLAHELIHALHYVTGTSHDEDEEEWTTGLGIYAEQPMSENRIRVAFGLKLRTEYY